MTKWIIPTFIILMAISAVAGGTYLWGNNSSEANPRSGETERLRDEGQGHDDHDDHEGGRHMGVDLSIRSIGRFLPTLGKMAIIIMLVTLVPQGFAYFQKNYINRLE